MLNLKRENLLNVIICSSINTRVTYRSENVDVDAFLFHAVTCMVSPSPVREGVWGGGIAPSFDSESENGDLMSPADRPQSEQIWRRQVMGGQPHGLYQLGKNGTPSRMSHGTRRTAFATKCSTMTLSQFSTVVRI